MKTYRPAILIFMAIIFPLTSMLLNAHDKKEHDKKMKSDGTFKAKPIVQLKGAKEWVMSVTFSPDGKKVAAGSYEQIQIFDVATKKEVKTIKMRNGYVRSLAFSPDGKILAAGGYQIVIFWNPNTGKRIRKLEDHLGYVGSVAFSKDGKKLLSASDDQTVRITNVADGKEIKVLTDPDYPVYAAVWSPDEKLIATASGDKEFVIKHGHVKLWDAITGKEVAQLEDHLRAATGVAFSADGKMLASTSEDEKINIYNVVTKKPLGFYPGHERPTNCALWVKENYIISGGGGRAQKGNDVKIWDRRDSTELATLSGHRGRVTSISLSVDGKTLASGSYDGTIVLWDISAVIADPEKTKKFVEEQEKKKKEKKKKR